MNIKLCSKILCDVRKMSQICLASHIWNEKGTYIIEVKARDICNDKSDLATLEVSMLKSKTTETKNNNEIHIMIYCDVSIKGTATEHVIRGSFLPGIRMFSIIVKKPFFL